MRLSMKWLFLVAFTICVSSVFAQQPPVKTTPTPASQPTVAPELSKPSDSTLAGSKKVTPQEDSSLWDTKTIVATCAVFVSFVSLMSSIYFSLKAREHNRRSVLPMPYILQPDYDDRIAVVVQNNGTGPMILQKAQARTDNRVGHLMDLIPPIPRHMHFKNFNRIVQERPIRPGDHVDLINLEINPNEDAAADYRDKLREALGDMTLELTYTDVYRSRFRVYSYKLDWFHRHRQPTPDPKS